MRARYAHEETPTPAEAYMTFRLCEASDKSDYGSPCDHTTGITIVSQTHWWFVECGAERAAVPCFSAK
jgi:hypothetical protein